MRRGGAVLALLTPLACAACGATALMKLPPGPGEPASDGPTLLSQAVRACHAVHSLTAEIAVAGSIAGRRVRARLSAGIAEPGSARLEAVMPFGPPLFIFAARNDDATVLLPREGRALEHGDPEAVLAAVVGVPLTPVLLIQVLTGCEAQAPVVGARRFGEEWRMVDVAAGNAVYLHREGAWRLVATIHDVSASGSGWRAEYREFDGDLPRAIRLTSLAPGQFDLRLDLAQVDINRSLEADVFRVPIPTSFSPITLDQLRRSGPLGSTTPDER